MLEPSAFCEKKDEHRALPFFFPLFSSDIRQRRKVVRRRKRRIIRDGASFFFSPPPPLPLPFLHYEVEEIEAKVVPGVEEGHR